MEADDFDRIIQWWTGEHHQDTATEKYIELPVAEPREERGLPEKLGLRRRRKPATVIRRVRNRNYPGATVTVEGYECRPTRKKSHESVPLKFTYTVSCVPDHEGDVASFCGSNVAKVAFETALDEWILDFARTHEGFFDNQGDFSELAEDVEEKAVRHGWDLELIDDRPYDSELDVDLQPYTNMQVVFHQGGTSDYLDMQVRVGPVLEGLPTSKAPPKNLHTQIRSRIEVIASGFIPRSIATDQDRCQKIVEAHLNRWMAKFGKRIHVDNWRVRKGPDSEPLPQLPKPEDAFYWDISVPPPGCKVTVLATLTDPESFEKVKRQNRAASIEEWLKKRIELWFDGHAAAAKVEDLEKSFQDDFTQAFQTAGHKLESVKIKPRPTKLQIAVMQAEMRSIEEQIGKLFLTMKDLEQTRRQLEKTGAPEEVQRRTKELESYDQKRLKLVAEHADLERILYDGGPPPATIKAAEILKSLPEPEEVQE